MILRQLGAAIVSMSSILAIAAHRLAIGLESGLKRLDPWLFQKDLLPERYSRSERVYRVSPYEPPTFSSNSYPVESAPLDYPADRVLG